MTVGQNSVPFKRHALWLSLVFAGLSVSPLHAQDNAATDSTPQNGTPQNNNVQRLQQVIVTGTRTSDRTVAESLSPIDVISPQDLAATGAGDLASALNVLLPSLDFPHTAITDGNDALRPATLRGLSPDDVLVLVNGKRYHTSSLVNYNYAVGRGSAPVDFNSIPMSAIDHIEVLRDGAAAQYGSDAIAGVVNIILKGAPGPGKNEIDTYGGIMDKGDGANNGVEGSVAVPLGVASNGASAPGWLRLSFNYQSVMNTNRAANTDPTFNYPPADIFGTNYPPPTPYNRYGEPAQKIYQAAINFQYDLSNNAELYGFLDVSDRKVTSNGFWRYWNDYDRNVPAVYPDGYLPQIANPTKDYQGVLGIRGKTDGGWHWDLSANYGQNNLQFNVQNSINTNLYYSTGSSPTSFYAGSYATKLFTLDFDANREFDLGFLKNPLSFAWGVEFKRDGYDIGAGDIASWYFNPNTVDPLTGNVYPGGAQVWPGITPNLAGDWTRTNGAVYIDLENDLTDKLSVGAAGRFEDYNDGIGSVAAGKLSARYQFTDSFALRGTVSNGFRAPSLAQMYYSSTVTLVENGQLVQVGTLTPSNPLAVSYGAKPLTPEQSTSISLGSVWQPTQNLSSTVDLYRIHVNHQIVYSDQMDNANPNYPQYSEIQFFLNGADITSRGADVVFNYVQDLGGWGNFVGSVSGNYNRISIDRVTDPILFGPYSQALLTDGTPRTKYVFSGDWNYNHFKLHADLTRYGEVSEISIDTPQSLLDFGAPSVGQVYPSRWITDLTASYNLREWTFSVGVDNLFNQYPSKVLLANIAGDEDAADGLQYSSLSPFGFDGRYWFAKVAYNW
jgi:iron complex outermembrane recepter protein